MAENRLARTTISPAPPGWVQSIIGREVWKGRLSKFSNRGKFSQVSDYGVVKFSNSVILIVFFVHFQEIGNDFEAFEENKSVLQGVTMARGEGKGESVAKLANQIAAIKYTLFSFNIVAWVSFEEGSGFSLNISHN